MMAGRQPWSTFGFFAALAIGVVLRLIWPEDIEFKADELWTVEQVRNFLAGGPWRWLGMPTSMGVPNPGMSLWIFISPGYLGDARIGPEFARAVQLFNVAGLIGFVIFARMALPAATRNIWYWAAALWAVNPIAIAFERKIWPPSVLPPFVVALIAAWWYRRFFWGSLAWGLLGALIGQLHTAAWFLTLALLIWTVLYNAREVHWPAWMCGNLIAGWPALPWVAEVLLNEGPSGHAWRVFPLLHYYIRWVLQPLGFGVEYLLGKDTLAFLAFPLIAGHATYFLAAAHVILVILTSIVFGQVIATSLRMPWPNTCAIFIGHDPDGLLVRAAFWGYGGFLTLPTFFGAGSHRHYLIAITPLMAIWLVHLVYWSDRSMGGEGARRLLVALGGCQALISVGLFWYIHTAQVIRGEYGATWKSEQIIHERIEPRLPPQGGN